VMTTSSNTVQPRRRHAAMTTQYFIRNKRKAASGMLLRPIRRLSLIVTILLPMTACAAKDCELHEALSRGASPDGTWVAIFFDNVCAAGFVTIAFSSVELMRPNETNSRNPSTARTVFSMDGFVDPKVAAVTWTGPRTLQVTISNDAWVGTQESAFADVTISYKYMPDDPIERACLNRMRSLSANELQKLGTRDAYIARCRAEGTPTTFAPVSLACWDTWDPLRKDRVCSCMPAQVRSVLMLPAAVFYKECLDESECPVDEAHYVETRGYAAGTRTRR
jgi:hypothetical protein